MRVAVIGTGNIGGTLGRAFAGAGHDVVFGARSPDDAARGGAAQVADVAAALDGADAVVLAVPGPAVDGLLDEHATALAGRLVLDAANRIGGGTPANSHDAITAKVPGVRYARVFNSLGFENLADPQFGATRADMFFSAPQADRAAVEELIAAVGLRPVYLGEGQQDVVDGVLRLWFTLVMGQGHSRHLAFRMLER
ncbi:MAG TPA: NAD(P)-binding domain-containing protein [Streptosporangiaceae bacterium]|nr:NAD(P)-binding domain-containing protein [Streptosporangiaceae bacterium]